MLVTFKMKSLTFTFDTVGFDIVKAGLYQFHLFDNRTIDDIKSAVLSKMCCCFTQVYLKSTKIEHNL